MWDVSTFLELGQKNPKIVFIKDCLSAYRSHEHQNISDPQMRVTLVLDWLSLICLSYGNRIYLETSEEFKIALEDYLFTVRYTLLPDVEELEKSPTSEFIRYKKIQNAFDKNDRLAVISEILDYIKDKTIDSEASKDLSPLGRIFS